MRLLQEDAACSTSPRLRGEVAALFARRVRGAIRESEPVERAPHPNPLPAKSGAREKSDFPRRSHA